MKFPVLIALFAQALFAEEVAVQDNDRIVGGSPAPLIPWMVSLQSGGRHFCGAQMLNPTTVLTAGHCVQGVSASQVTVRLGITNLSGGGGETLRASRIISHPGFDYDSLANDVAIIKLATPSKNTQFVQLDTTGIATPGLSVVNYGWGNIRNGGPSSSTLLQVGLTVRADSECQNSLDGFDGRWSVCAHGATDVETPCNGDSGGPLVANGNILVGTVSYGDSCRSYSVFARVSYLKSFIQQYL
ncbi:trypsin-like protease [Neoconidiobolus thromboides FSU 785]|nr:trypsin-like protease [Neoconidiobolus thromboides FSU 785]